MHKGGFSVIAETSRSELASSRRLAEKLPAIAWIWQIIKHKPNFSISTNCRVDNKEKLGG